MFTLECDICHKPVPSKDIQYVNRLKVCPACYANYKRREAENSDTEECACDACAIPQRPEISQITIETR